MDKTYDVIEYKNRLMNTICSINELVELINNPEVKYPQQLKEKNVFSTMRLPGTQTDASNYICFDYNSEIFRKNKVYKLVTINIGIVCHTKNIRTTNGNRHDLIAGIIIEKLNWSDILGFELHLISDKESILEKEYNARTLIFQNLAPNSLELRE